MGDGRHAFLGNVSVDEDMGTGACRILNNVSKFLPFFPLGPALFCLSGLVFDSILFFWSENAGHVAGEKRWLQSIKISGTMLFVVRFACGTCFCI
jgi:hypothetical protein